MQGKLIDRLWEILGSQQDELDGIRNPVHVTLFLWSRGLTFVMRESGTKKVFSLGLGTSSSKGRGKCLVSGSAGIRGIDRVSKEAMFSNEIVAIILKTYQIVQLIQCSIFIIQRKRTTSIYIFSKDSMTHSHGLISWRPEWPVISIIF